MLLKAKDSVEPTITRLENLLAANGLSFQQRERIKEEKEPVRAGKRGEREAAYRGDY